MKALKQAKAVLRRGMPDAALAVARPVRDRAARVRFHGSGVNCPICGGEWRAFAAFNGRKGARCPRCGSLERHRQMWLFLTRNSDVLIRPQRVLHVAPEQFLRDALRVTHGAGYVYGDIADPHAYLDVTKLGFNDASFDVIICSHVFEHVPDDATAMSEILRVLAPDGWAILDAPVDDSREHTDEDPSVTSANERRKRFGQWDHCRYYGRDYTDRLRTAGFEVAIDPNPFRPDEKARYGLRDRHDHIYLCRPKGSR
jgi:hypothetical protein